VAAEAFVSELDVASQPYAFGDLVVGLREVGSPDSGGGVSGDAEFRIELAAVKTVTTPVPVEIELLDEEALVAEEAVLAGLRRKDRLEHETRLDGEVGSDFE